MRVGGGGAGHLGGGTSMCGGLEVLEAVGGLRCLCLEPEEHNVSISSRVE